MRESWQAWDEKVFLRRRYFFPLAALGMRSDALSAMLRTQAGIKKMCRNILPGRGGILDGMDSLMPLLPCIAMLIVFSMGLYPY